MGQAAYSKGLAGVIADESSICLVDGQQGQLFYRGYPIEQIVAKKSFDECAYMILRGEFPDAAALASYRAEIRDNAALPDFANELIDALPKGTHPMQAIQAVLPLLGSFRPSDFTSRRMERDDGTKYSVVEPRERLEAEVAGLLAKIPTIIARFHRTQAGLAPVAPDPELTLLANFLYMFNGERPTDEDVHVFEVCEMLQMEHGFNASTFTARVVASTQSPLANVLSAAVGSLYGRLHGGADEASFRMARDEIATPDAAAAYVTETLAAGGLIMGVGHRVYKTVDPRARILKKLAGELNASKGGEKERAYKTLENVEAAVQEVFAAKGKDIYANVEFYKGPVFNALDIPTDYFTSMFVIARSFGWAAHVMELWADHRIYRPGAQFVGTRDLDVPE